MPRPRSAMRKIREVLRLSLGEGLSPRQVRIAVGLPRTTVQRYLERAARQGLSWPLPQIRQRPQQTRRRRRAPEEELLELPHFVEKLVRGQLDEIETRSTARLGPPARQRPLPGRALRQGVGRPGAAAASTGRQSSCGEDQGRG
jgi:hypothetical protein